MEKIRKTAQVVLNALGSPEGELSILIVDDVRMAELNKEYFDREGPTNVIAFPQMERGEGQRERGEGPIHESEEDMFPELLGDVVISADTAAREGDMGGISMEERFTQLLVHGILHLFGYDHENNEEEAAQMDAESEAILHQLKETEENE